MPATTRSRNFTSTDQSRAFLWATRPGQLQNLYRVDLASPGTEIRLSTNLGASDLISSLIPSRDFSVFAYTHEDITAPAGRRLSRVDTTGAPSPVVLANSGADYVGRATDIRPDNGAVLYTRVTTVGGSSGTGYEITGAGATPSMVMAGPVTAVFYDGSGDRVFAAGPPPRITSRASFATSQPLGFPSFSWFTTGAGPQRQSIATSVNGFVYLFNLAAPDVALQLSSFPAAPQPGYILPLLIPVGPATTP